MIRPEDSEAEAATGNPESGGQFADSGEEMETGTDDDVDCIEEGSARHCS